MTERKGTATVTVVDAGEIPGAKVSGAIRQSELWREVTDRIRVGEVERTKALAVEVSPAWGKRHGLRGHNVHESFAQTLRRWVDRHAGAKYLVFVRSGKVYVTLRGDATHRGGADGAGD